MTIDTTTRKGSPSGRFVLRLDPDLHESLREAARATGTSLNGYCARKLASPNDGLDEGAAAVIRRAASIAGDFLLGVVAFGSWSRGEDTASSDMDVLFTLGEGIGIRRELYRRWDQGGPVIWRDLPVAPHFAHLPSPSDPISGLWAEVSQDGLVLYERDWAISRYLVAVRRRILSGELERRIAGGRAYWVQSDV